MGRSVVFVVGDDWVAMYVDSEKVIDGHSLHFSHVLDALGIVYERRDAPRIDPFKGEVYYAPRLEDVKAEPYEDAE